MLGFLYEPFTNRTGVTILGGRGIKYVERPVLKDVWFFTGIALGVIDLLGALALIMVTTYNRNHGGNAWLPFCGVIALVIVLGLAVAPWWRWKIQLEARRKERNEAN